MQVTVYGASGKVGRLVVAKLLADQHTVVAFVHQRNPFAGQTGVSVVSGSVDEVAAVTLAAAGSQVLISTLGSWGTATKTVVSTGTQAIITAAQEHHIRRVITLTGASAFCNADTPTTSDRLTHWLLNLLAPKILRDGERHLQLLEASTLDWTALRSPPMLRFGAPKYQLVAKLPSLLATIPRRAVVQAIIDQVPATDSYKQAPVIRRG